MSKNDFVIGPRYFFNAPWEPIVVRRGDALGLRALADQFAEAIAPGLSNRVRDGRWVTILAWCLVKSHHAFHASGGRSVSTRVEQQDRYAWPRHSNLDKVRGDEWQLLAGIGTGFRGQVTTSSHEELLRCNPAANRKSKAQKGYTIH